nr:PQQ-dependent sugar dehydrogenase [Nocardioides convexus]
MPSNSTGRHGGCRLLVLRYGALVVGTGDAARGTNPRNLASLGGKVLRMNRFTGAPWPANPWYGSKGNRRWVLSLRPPQRAGARTARRRQPVVGRARQPTATTRST